MKLSKILVMSGKTHSLFDKIRIIAVALALSFGVSACSDGDDDYEVFTSIEGTITDYNTGEPLDNAVVTLSPSGLSRQTDVAGYYKFEDIDAQQYTVTVQRSGYQPNRKTVMAVSGETQIVDIQLTVIPQN